MVIPGCDKFQVGFLDGAILRQEIHYSWRHEEKKIDRFFFLFLGSSISCVTWQMLLLLKYNKGSSQTGFLEKDRILVQLVGLSEILNIALFA